MYKISPELIRSWGHILNAVPDSAIILLPFGPNWSSNYPKDIFSHHLVETLSKYKINSKRIIIVDPQPVPDRDGIREYLGNCDIYLDSFPFSGTTSFIEPLEVGLPIVTIEGKTFRSSMGAALLKSLGLEVLIAEDESDYIRIAVKLGTNEEFCSRMHELIKGKMRNTPVFLDSHRYSNDIQHIFENILSPRHTR
jgi:predicted O-linked N-acetylglucosamine transferase (SPINDLY family)